MKISPFKALTPNYNLLTSPDSFTSDIKKGFKEFLTSGMIQTDKEDAYYVYQILDDGTSHTGLIAGTAIKEYLSGNIKKHEQTLNAKEQAHLQRFLQWNSTMKPILLVYPKVQAISNFLLNYTKRKKPDFEVKFELVPQIHRFWKVSGKSEIKKVTKLFESHVKRAYIADGHHRIAATATLYEKFPKMHYHMAFAAFFSFNEVTILPYNRVVADLNGMSPAVFIAKLSKYFKIQPLTKPKLPKKKHQILMTIQHEWFRLEWRKKKIKNGVGEVPVLLDSYLLNHFVFSMLGIEDPRMDRRLMYVGGDVGLEGLLRKVGDDPSKVGFYLYPVAMDDLITLADLDKTLPPKSTWFEPRLKNGLIMKYFE